MKYEPSVFIDLLTVFSFAFRMHIQLKVSKSQKGILVSSNLPKIDPKYKRIFAQVSKMGVTKKINALYLSNNHN